MQLSSVNVGRPQPLANAKRSGETGIYKEPLAQAVSITDHGLVGDAVLDKKHHGGPDQAVYVYGTPDYAWWSQTLGADLEPGTFGDNLTITELESAALQIGDRLHFETVVLEVTAPRIPCVTLATRMGDPQFVKRFRAAERPGLYCRVITPGPIQAGEPVRLESYRGETVMAIEMFRLYYDNEAPEAAIRRVLAAPIAVRDRHAYEERLIAHQTKVAKNAAND